VSDRKILEAGRRGMLRRGALRLVRPVFLAALLVLPIRPALEAAANTIVVNNVIDPTAAGYCTLYEAIANANAAGSVYSDCVAGSGVDTITFNLSPPSTIVLTSPSWPVTILHTLTIDGTGQAITINGSGNQIFVVSSTATLNLNNLTIGGGSSTTGNGGAISNSHFLNINNSTFSGNTTTFATGNGGAVYNAGTLYVTNSTFGPSLPTFAAGNSAPNGNGGAIYSDTGSTLSVTNSTFYDNSAGSGATGSGGGIYSSTGSTTTTVVNSTFYDNAAGLAGTGANIDNAGGTFTISNSILDLDNGSPGLNCSAGIHDGGYNIYYNTAVDTSCGFTGTGANGQPIGFVNPGLDAGFAGADGLAPNGGPTDTIALLPTNAPNSPNPAIAAIPLAQCMPPLSLNTDQRGYPRPALGANVFFPPFPFSSCDIGAYEFQTTLSVGNVTVAPGAVFPVSAILGPIQSSSSVCASVSPVIFTFQGNVVAANAIQNGPNAGLAGALFFAPTTGGTYELQASYAGGTFPCGPAVGTALVTVPGTSATATTSLTVASVTAAPGSSFTASATLSSSTSACTSGQPVTFTLQSSPPVTSLPVTTGANGVATATFAAPSGNNGAIFLILASFAGNPSCGPSNGGNTLTLGPATTTTVTVTPVTETEAAPFTAMANVVSSLAGCTFAAGSITFTLETSPPQTATGPAVTTPVGGGPVSATSQFTVPSSGTFQIVASFGGSSVPLCAAGTGSGLLTVTSPNATATALTVADVTAPEGATFTAAAELVPGTCGADQEIAFTFRGAPAFATTNGSGVANITFTAPTTPGVYPIQASFAGSPSCGGGSATGQLTVPTPTPTTLTISNVTARPATLFIATAKLKPASCASGQNITFMFNGSPRTSVTNLSGQATTSYVAPGTAGPPLPISASFAGTPYCAPIISNTASVNVQGAAGPPILNVLPGSVSFGSDPLGGSSLQTITVANDASTPANVSSITIANAPGTTGTPFTETDNCVPGVGPRSQCSISVGYAPSVAGRQNASLQIHLNNNTASKTVPLSGTGIVVASAVPSRISYRSQKRGTTSDSSQVTVTNNLAGGLAIAAVSTSGDFVVTKNGCANVLKSRSSCKIKVAFEPTASGTLRGSLTIIDTVSPVPLTVTLIGTGH